MLLHTQLSPDVAADLLCPYVRNDRLSEIDYVNWTFRHELSPKIRS
jgi:hypothetical protein